MNESDGAYDGQIIRQPPQRLTQEEKLKLLDTHPLFTGRCPCCEIPLKLETPPQWHCQHCGATPDNHENCL